METHVLGNVPWIAPLVYMMMSQYLPAHDELYQAFPSAVALCNSWFGNIVLCTSLIPRLLPSMRHKAWEEPGNEATALCIPINCLFSSSSSSPLQLLPPSFSSDKVSPSQQQLLARRRLKKLVSHKRQELQHHACIHTQAGSCSLYEKDTLSGNCTQQYSA